MQDFFHQQYDLVLEAVEIGTDSNRIYNHSGVLFIHLFQRDTLGDGKWETNHFPTINKKFYTKQSQVYHPHLPFPYIFETRGRSLPDIYWQLGAWFQIYRELEDEGHIPMTSAELKLFLGLRTQCKIALLSLPKNSIGLIFSTLQGTITYPTLGSLENLILRRCLGLCLTILTFGMTEGTGVVTGILGEKTRIPTTISTV